MFPGVAEYAEAVDHFVGYELRVAAAYFAVMQIIVAAAAADVRRECRRQFFRLVAVDQVDHVIRYQGREPAHLFPGMLEILGNPHRGCRHHFDLGWVAARGLGAFMDESEAPLDYV